MNSNPSLTVRERFARIQPNLLWTWGPGARLLGTLAADLSETTDGVDPGTILARASDASLARAALAHADDLRAVEQAVEGHRSPEWSLLNRTPVAYFSMEFGIHESLAIYSGGLGVLAGDHLKSASDLGLPLVAVGFFYREGYFTQTLDKDGWQQAAYPKVEPSAQLARAIAPGGEPLAVEVETRGGVIHADVWEIGVGGVRLFLLDADVERNDPDDRALTHRLYGGDERTRIRQELLLGVGGLRALRAMGIEPGVLHLNEGHCAFAALEEVAARMDRGATYDDAVDAVRGRCVFTTHTPVPAGHDRFVPELLLEHLAPYGQRLGLTPEALLGLGRIDPRSEDETFCMTVLALKLADRVNGVSFLHGRVSRAMWERLWPKRSRNEVPIGHITNGVHVPTFMAPQMSELLDRHLGAGWQTTQHERSTWAPAFELPTEALTTIRRTLKDELIAKVRTRASEEARARGESDEVVAALGQAIDPNALLIGFARRFATYKRAALILRDREQLVKLVNDPDHPVCLVFAGKAHPKDEGGKKLLKLVFEASRDPQLLGKVILLSGYDLGLGRALTRGVDLWLNNPRRPKEASGTSGQKVVFNGGLNLSVLDGWWAEAYDGSNGFAIGEGDVHQDAGLQDRLDREALWMALEEEVLPCWRDQEAWTTRVRRSMATLGWRFNAQRMVRDYAVGAYLPAAGDMLRDPRA